MNKLSYILLGLAYVLLSFAYVFRGKIGFGNKSINLDHRQMQIIVSILYVSIGYVYFVDGVYHKFDDAFDTNIINHNNNDIDELTTDENNKEIKSIKKRNKYMRLLTIYIIIVVITYYIAKLYIKNEP